jgi:signal peptidase I
MRGFLKFLAWVIGVLAVICLLLYVTLFDVWRMPADDPKMSVSTQPNMTGGDLMIVARHGAPDRGDLVKCADPQAPGRFIVARVLAKPREKVVISEEVPSIDGTRNPSPHACDPPTVTLTHPDTQEEVELGCGWEDLGTQFEVLRNTKTPEAPSKWTVEEGKVYLISDNRDMHVDSRDYGTVDPDTCRHILMRLWSKDGPGDAKHRFNLM